MTRQEAGKLLVMIASAWPKFEVTEDKLLLWHEMFRDLDYQTVATALKKLMLESTFPPSIADLRKSVVDITTVQADRIEPAEAWGMVTQAIHDYGYIQEQKAMESLPKRVSQVVKMIGYQELCQSTEPAIVRAQFMRMFEQVKNRQVQDALLPVDLQKAIANLSEKKALPAGLPEKDAILARQAF